jgi:hypothetical protein
MWTVAGVAALVIGASSMPVFAADNVTVTAQVIANGAACLTVSANGSNVDFGTAPFLAGVGTTTVTVGAPNVTVTSCSTGSETVLARGTDATAAGVVWTLITTAPCGSIPPPTTNQYNLGLRAGGNTPDTFLSTTNTSLGTVAANGTLGRTPIMRMPCTGSSGSGQTMTMSYVFTATVP